MSLTCAGHETVPEQQVLHGGGPVERGGIGIVDGEAQSVGYMIVETLANTRKITDDRHTYRVELLSRSYAAVQEDLRRVNGACTTNKTRNGLITGTRADAAITRNPRQTV